MHMIRIALRNVLRQHQRSLLLGSAIGFGFMIVIVLNSLTAGLSRNFSLNFADISGGHVFVSGTELSALGSKRFVISDTEALKTALSSIEADIRAASVRTERFSSFIFGSKEQSTLLTGVDFTSEATFLDNIELRAGDIEDILSHEDSLILPEKTVDKLGVALGESVIVKATTVSGQDTVIDLTVRGISTSGEGIFDQFFSRAYAPLVTVDRMVGIEPEQYVNYQIQLDNLDEAPAIATRLREALAEVALVKGVNTAEDLAKDVTDGEAVPEPTDPEQEAREKLADEYTISLNDDEEEADWQGTKFNITTIQEQISGLEEIETVIQNIALGIFIVLLIIIMIGIMNSYRMVMLERSQEIGTMRAMGVQRGGIRSIFIWEAILVGLLGVVLGLLLAGLLILILQSIPLARGNFFDFFLYNGHLRFSPSLLSILGNALLICVMSMLAVLIPAHVAARLEPAEALRN